jgi:Cyclin, N-terminal domain/Cyclin, C-terminal domain
VVDFCNFNRETVSIAMSVLDRFLATRIGATVLVDRSQFQLASMTALYLSVKTQEPEVMSAELVSTLSRGAHTEHEVEEMERRILLALTWQVNPPTTLSFVREYLKLLPHELLDNETKATLMEICKFQSELAVADYSLIVVGASHIAYASLMNGLESLCMDRTILGYVSSILSQAAGINLFSEQLVHVQIRLCQAVAQHTQPMQTLQQPQMVHPKASTPYGGACGRSLGPKSSSFKESPCTVTRMEA